MQIALVIGSTISTLKDEAIRGRKLLVVRKADTGGTMTGEPCVAVDAVIMGVIDSLEWAARSHTGRNDGLTWGTALPFPT